MNSRLEQAAREMIEAGKLATRRIASLIPFDSHIDDESVRKVVREIGDSADRDIDRIKAAVANLESVLQELPATTSQEPTQPSAPEPQWLPIATAPHGEHVVLLYRSGLSFDIGWHGLGESSHWNVGSRTVLPSHWSPIPRELPPEFRA